MRRRLTVTYLKILLTFLRLGCTSFGGPIAHLGYFREEFVVRRRWLSELEYANLVALCQFIPGPASSQVGAAVGYIRAGYPGALLAWIGFTLPSGLIMFVVATSLLSMHDPGLIEWVQGLKLVAVVIVAQAVIGMQKQLCNTFLTRLIALCSASVILIASYSPFLPLVVITGGVIAGLLCANIPQQLDANHSSPAILSVASKQQGSITLLSLFVVILIGLPLWTAQANGLVLLFDKFYRSGALVFGGGHVVLPLLFNEWVASGLVTQTEFFIGYGTAQAVPGPLFTFATFLGAVGNDENTAVAAITATLAIFLPGMLLLFAALPFWHKVSQSQLGKRGLIGANAAVVGLLLATLINPILMTTLSGLGDITIVLVTSFALIRFNLHSLWAILACLIGHVLLSMI